MRGHDPRVISVAELRAVLAQDLARGSLPNRRREDFNVEDQIRWVTWGDSGSSSFSAADGIELIVPDATLAQLVDARYQRPLVWQLHFVLDATQGAAWVVGDQVIAEWQLRIGNGKANISVPVQQGFTVATASTPPVLSNLLSLPISAQTIQVAPSLINASVGLAGVRTIKWGVWAAPYME